MVKHAADEELPLLTADERVSLVFEKFTAGKTFSAEQKDWLDRIQAHLKENLSLNLEDFETMPIFTRYGGRSQAYRVFGPALPQLIGDINEAIAA